MNGRTFTFADMVDETGQWWFPTDSAVLSGDLALSADGVGHVVDVELELFLPYLIVDDEVLRIRERDSKAMRAVMA